MVYGANLGRRQHLTIASLPVGFALYAVKGSNSDKLISLLCSSHKNVQQHSSTVCYQPCWPLKNPELAAHSRTQVIRPILCDTQGPNNNWTTKGTHTTKCTKKRPKETPVDIPVLVFPQKRFKRNVLKDWTSKTLQSLRRWSIAT